MHSTSSLHRVGVHGTLGAPELPHIDSHMHITFETKAALQALEVAETELAGQRRQQEGLQKDVKRWEERKQKEDEVGLLHDALLRCQQALLGLHQHCAVLWPPADSLCGLDHPEASTLRQRASGDTHTEPLSHLDQPHLDQHGTGSPKTP